MWLRRCAGAWAIDDALRERGVPRMHRWGRGVDTRRFTPSRCDHQLRMSLAREGELLVGYVGRLAIAMRLLRLTPLVHCPHRQPGNARAASGVRTGGSLGTVTRTTADSGRAGTDMVSNPSRPALS